MMPSEFVQFSGPLNTEYAYDESDALGSDYWRVTKTFRYYIGGLDSQRWVTVPAGYLTDGASVPRIFWNIIPPWGRYGAATTVHDILCEYLEIYDHGEIKKITRAEADAILKEAMIVLGVKKQDVDRIYNAVCLYRIVSGVNKPMGSKRKRILEATWAIRNLGV